MHGPQTSPHKERQYDSLSYVAAGCCLTLRAERKQHQLIHFSHITLLINSDAAKPLEMVRTSQNYSYQHKFASTWDIISLSRKPFEPSEKSNLVFYAQSTGCLTVSNLVFYAQSTGCLTVSNSVFYAQSTRRQQ